MTKKLKEKKIPEFCYRTSCRSFLLLTESRFISRFIYRNVIRLLWTYNNQTSNKVNNAINNK